MSTATAAPVAPLRITVEDASQVSSARSGAVQVAHRLAMPPAVADRIALVATELAENLHRHATGGELLVVPPQAGGDALSLLAVDRGPGVENFDRCLVDGYSTAGTLGGGLGAVRRLATGFDAVSEPGRGTVVCASFVTSGARPPASTPPFEVGVIGFPVPPETVNGDGFAVARRGSRLLAMVADGLGHGPDAARASAAATAELAGLTELGPTALLGEVNTRIAGTRGAAVSVVSLELDAARLGGEIVTAGLGNVSVLVSGPDGSSRRVATSYGTAGTRRQARPVEQRTAFPAHGTLVLHTDGLTTRWTLDGRAALLRHSVLVVAAALWRDHERSSDDSLVLVARAGRAEVTRVTIVDLVKIALDGTTDATALRHLGRRAGVLLGLDDTDATRVATAMSELGRLAQRHRPAQIRLQLADPANADAMLRIVFGFPTARESLAAERQVATAVDRLMDVVDVTDDSIAVGKRLPRPVAAGDLDAVRDELLSSSSADQGAPLQSLNDELVATLVALREREAELVALNVELDQTNRGVVALYAELEERAAEVRNAQRAVFEELERALRPPPPLVPGLELDVRYLPAQANSPTGGDLYDWFVLPDGTVHITVVDVRGHGVTSTRDALQVTHCVRTLTLEGHEFGHVLSRTHAVLQSSAGNVVATALLALVDPRSGMLQLAGAGHPAALRIPDDDQATFLEAPGRPIGYEGGGSTGVTTVQLEPGETVLLYTDGLIEIRRDVIEGLQTLAESATTARGMALARLLDSTLLSCAQGDVLDDDTLLLALRWVPGAG